MANQQHIDMLKRGVKAWNRWRQEHPDVRPDFRHVHLREAFIEGSNIPGDVIIQLHHEGINFSETDFRRAYLDGSIFSHADFSEAIFDDAILTRLILQGANFNKADLTHAFLKEVDLKGVNLSNAYMGWTIFGNIDLSETIGLETVKHRGPSTIGIDTIYRSGGHIPEDFLRKAGVSDTFIEYTRSLVVKPLDYYTCFISYSSKDQAFAERLYADLQGKGVRCWFAPEHMKIGDKIRHRIDESIRLYDKLLLVLSTHALASDWVQTEVEIAFEKERSLKQRGLQQRVLFPIRLDETVMQTTEAWAADVRRTRHIGDFTRWKQHDDYQQAFERLLRDLKAEV